MNHRHHRVPQQTASAALALSTALLLALGAATVSAQQIYRIVGPDGRVTFTDKPPAPAAQPAAPAATTAAASAGPALPFELRQVVSRFPVVFYTGPSCGPCDAGRSYLQRRGVPFTEKTVATPDDAQALQRISGDTALPLITIGGQQIKGFSEVEWAQFLDVAGYPKTSALPAGWRNPAPAPLVVVQQASAAAPADGNAAGDGAAPADGQPAVNAVNRRRPAGAAGAPGAAGTPPADAARNSNPAGIRF